jgi:hypothetical protein
MAHGNLRVDGRELNRRTRIAAAGAVNLWLDQVLADSQLIVPLDEGPLSESAGVDYATADDPRGRIVYRKVYAARQHEELTWKHLPGRQAKYLETPFKSRLPELQPLVQRSISAAIRVST